MSNNDFGRPGDGAGSGDHSNGRYDDALGRRLSGALGREADRVEVPSDAWARFEQRAGFSAGVEHPNGRSDSAPEGAEYPGEAEPENGVIPIGVAEGSVPTSVNAQRPGERRGHGWRVPLLAAAAVVAIAVATSAVVTGGFGGGQSSEPAAGDGANAAAPAGSPESSASATSPTASEAATGADNAPRQPTTTTVGPHGVITVERGTPSLMIDVYEDALCPYCAQFEQRYGPQLTAAIGRGELGVRYHMVDFLNGHSPSGTYSTRAYAALLTVAKQSSGRPHTFRAFHASLFASMVQPEEDGSKDLSNEDLAELAKSAGASRSVQQVIASGAMVTQAKADAAANWTSLTQLYASLDRGPGTPTVAHDGTVVDIGSTDWLTTLLTQNAPSGSAHSTSSSPARNAPVPSTATATPVTPCGMSSVYCALETAPSTTTGASRTTGEPIGAEGDSSSTTGTYDCPGGDKPGKTVPGVGFNGSDISVVVQDPEYVCFSDGQGGGSAGLGSKPFRALEITDVGPLPARGANATDGELVKGRLVWGVASRRVAHITATATNGSTHRVLGLGSSEAFGVEQSGAFVIQVPATGSVTVQALGAQDTVIAQQTLDAPSAGPVILPGGDPGHAYVATYPDHQKPAGAGDSGRLGLAGTVAVVHGCVVVKPGGGSPPVTPIFPFTHVGTAGSGSVLMLDGDSYAVGDGITLSGGHSDNFRGLPSKCPASTFIVTAGD